MRSFRRVTQRVAPAVASVASVVVFATCDWDKISGTPKEILPSEVAKIFSISPAGDSLVTLGGTVDLGLTPGTGISFTGTSQRWESSAPTIARVDTVSGVVTGLTIGSAVITARLIAPELDTGYTRTHAVRVRYKGIKVAAIDSIAGKGLQRAITVQGTNAANALQLPAIPNGSLTLTAHDSGSANTNVVSVSGATVVGKSNGIAYVVAAFEEFKDSVKVKMRQVAKSIVFPLPDYTATALNVNLPRLPMTITDQGDSVMTTSPVMRFASSDTTVVTIDSLTGIHRVKKVDTARIFVRVDAVNTSQKLLVSQAPATLTRFAGDAQTGTVAQVLPISPTVTVLDAGNTPIVGTQVIFRRGVGLNASITDSVKTTDANGRATLGSWKLGDNVLPPGSHTVTATAGAITTTFTATAVAGPKRKLRFSVQPTSSASSVPFNPVVKVQVVDSLNNLVANATDNITIAIANNPGGSPLGGITTRAAVAGEATFTGLEVDAGFGQGYTLEATAAGLQSAVSNGFDVFGVKQKLGFTTQPASGTATATMAPVRVSVLDAQNIPVTNATDSVTLSFAANPSGATLGGTVKVAAVNGVATFNTLSVSTAVTNYQFNATAPGLTGATSSTFSIAAVGAAARLAFQQQPTTVGAGAVIQPPITVRVVDASGALVTNSTQQVTLSVEGNPTGVVLGGQVAKNAQNGVATFDNITVNKAGTGYKLVATATGSATISSATSSTFDVNVGVANKLGFVVQPTNTPAGQNISPAVIVEVQDASGNRVTTGTFGVTLTHSGCTTATLSGGGSQNTVNGVVSFGQLTLSVASGATCTLAANATGLQPATSTNFVSIAATGPAKLKFTNPPASLTTAGSPMNGGTVAIQDVNGGSVTASSSVLISLSVIGPGSVVSGTTSGTTTTTISFPSLVFTTAGSYRLVAQATGFDPDTSAAFTIAPGSINKVAFVTQPTSIVAGAPFSPVVQVAIQDVNNNTVTTASNAVTIQVSPTSVPFASGANTITVNAVNGVATFTGAGIKKAQAAARLTASGAGVTGTATSNPFDITAGPISALGFVVQPSASVAAGASISPAVQVSAQDSVGNTIADFANPITLALSGGPGGATFGGTKTATPNASGIASFSNLTIDKAGTGYRLSASASGVANGLSNAFAVVAGTPTKVVFLQQPQNTFFNAPLGYTGPAVQIGLQDAFSNTVTANNSAIVRITASGPSTQFRCNGTNNATTCDHTVSSGVATLGALTNMTTAGAGYQLSATVTNIASITAATSNAFSVGAFDAKSKLAWNNQPVNGSYGVQLLANAGLTPNVFVLDQWNNLITNATDAVTVAIGNDASPTTTLGGTKTIAAAGGGANFGDLTLDKGGTGFTLTASAAGLTSATSNAFNISTPGVLVNAALWDMVRVGGTIFYTENSLVKSISTIGGSVTNLANSNNARRIVSDGSSIYWIERGTNNSGDAFIKKRTAGGTVSTLTVALTSTNEASGSLATDGTNVYFIARNLGANGVTVRSVSVNAAGATPSDLFATTNSGSPFFTVSGGNVYYFNPANSTINRVPAGGGSSTPIANNVQNVTQLQLVGTTLFFAQSDGLFRSLANANTTSSPVTPQNLIDFGLNAVTYDFVIDNNQLYVEVDNVANGTIHLRRYSTSNFGATPATLSTTAEGFPRTLLLDAQSIYFTDNVNSTLRLVKLPR